MSKAPKSVRPKKGKNLALGENNDAVKYQEHLRDFNGFDKKTSTKLKKSYFDLINEKVYHFTKSLSKAVKVKDADSVCTLCEFIGDKSQKTTQEAEMSKEFFHEIEIYIKLRPHTGICKFDGYYLIPQKTIVADNFPNGSLSDIYEKLKLKSISKSGKLQWNNLLKAKIIFGTACAMMHLHANQVFHGNLQPSQIYFDKNWQPQLTGYASFYQEHIPESFEDYEDDDEFKESYLYIPPEILDHKFDSKSLKKADVFSFGILSYTVIADGEENLLELLEDEDFYQKYKSGKLRPEFPKDVNPLLKGIITNSWNPDPKKRPLFSQIIRALQNNKAIFPDMDIGQYEIYQEEIFDNIDIPPEDQKLLKSPKAPPPEPPRDSDSIIEKKKPKKLERGSSSTSIPKPKPIEDYTSKELGGDEEFNDKLEKAQDGQSDALVNVGYALHKGFGCKKNDFIAFLFYKKAAELKSKMGMYNCALLMSTGCGTEKNEKKAMEMMKEATGIEDIDDADEEHDNWYSKAIITYGQMLQSINKDKEAEKYFKAAINLGKDNDGDSYYAYAKFLEKKGNMELALKNYIEASKKGHKMAANDYAVTLLTKVDGKDPDPANVKKAIQELRKASQQNQPAACTNYGNILFSGKYKQKKNQTLAVNLFRQAAEKDYPDGCFMLGYALSHGEGVEEDKESAKKYFKKAADQGHTIAMVQLARLLQEDDEDEKAADYLKRGAELKDPVAMLRYGEILEKGRGVVKDKEKAMKLYKEAADKGNKQAKAKLEPAKKGTAAKDSSSDDDKPPAKVPIKKKATAPKKEESSDGEKVYDEDSSEDAKPPAKKGVPAKVKKEEPITKPPAKKGAKKEESSDGEKAYDEDSSEGAKPPAKKGVPAKKETKKEESSDGEKAYDEDSSEEHKPPAKKGAPVKKEAKKEAPIAKPPAKKGAPEKKETKKEESSDGEKAYDEDSSEEHKPPAKKGASVKKEAKKEAPIAKPPAKKGGPAKEETKKEEFSDGEKYYDEDSSEDAKPPVKKGVPARKETKKEESSDGEKVYDEDSSEEHKPPVKKGAPVKKEAKKEAPIAKPPAKKGAPEKKGAKKEEFSDGEKYYDEDSSEDAKPPAKKGGPVKKEAKKELSIAKSSKKTKKAHDDSDDF